ncbi:hypothetical protein VQH23_04025 [Pararoseomonas sp. SCSIO 73927]|uniref:hypothetical protein n=1 Tax=Pararoseomonas sp. SCSIO 73927 TaxID=3114537 RepID=UPI0030CF0987
MDLTTLRPTEPTSSAIAAALTRAETMRVTVQESVTAAKANRDALLLDGDALQLATAERTLTDARGDGERVEAIVAELTNRLASTRKAEAVNEVRASLATSRDATDARRVWWGKNGRKLQALLREATALHRGQQDAVEDTRRKQVRLVKDYDDTTELTDAIFAEIPPAEDVDNVAYRLLDKVADAWEHSVFLDQPKEAV